MHASDDLFLLQPIPSLVCHVIYIYAIFLPISKKKRSSKGLLPIIIPRKLLGGQARRFSQFLDALWPVQWEKMPRATGGLHRWSVARYDKGSPCSVLFKAFLEKVCGWCFLYSNIRGDIKRHALLIKILKGVDLKETWWMLVVKLLVKLSFQADCSDRKYQRVLIYLWWLWRLFTLPAVSPQDFGIQSSANPVLWCHIFYLIGIQT